MDKKLSLQPVKIDFNLLSPYIGEKQTDIHYNGHYMKYINNFNKYLTTDKHVIQTYNELAKTYDTTQFRNKLLLTITETNDNTSDLYHNVAQIFNHELYWNSLTDINKSLYALCTYKNKLFKSDKDLTNFYNDYIDKGTKLFGSGWLWIITSNNNNKLELITTSDAIIPLTHNFIAVIDLWEHAYYIDYLSERKKYLEKTFKIIDWEKIYNKL
ncbi:MAG: superoxide dismutase [Gaeavirus sp.]|uniref:superoxide dismutase n=1 Tax=Gaeavirus sp. TaxID=2487767 RepID=A0A3G5A250_9VIRU|nr:MAG: superoxide dismutase [Gaeavirus sp.]